MGIGWGRDYTDNYRVTSGIRQTTAFRPRTAPAAPDWRIPVTIGTRFRVTDTSWIEPLFSVVLAWYCTHDTGERVAQSTLSSASGNHSESTDEHTHTTGHDRRNRGIEPRPSRASPEVGDGLFQGTCTERGDDPLGGISAESARHGTVRVRAHRAIEIDTPA